ncbi:ABC transporter permease [Agromyces sp. Leaf222]|uniref:ABC transporter permease n=1 Tax=Agromyces sp. Leaf222 TaxID=1735688 RepID=UPI000700426F|nr:ABC transporter permease [Agromyces sp. Leaf222]KQM82556.1 hypothetical protein ASE68_04065 [Agromyces sp. Leaf222]
MTATTADASALARTRVSFGGVFASEAVKLASLRSSWWLMGSAVVGMLLIVAFWTVAVPGATEANVLDAVAKGFTVSLLFVLLVGAMIATADHENHAISVYFSAVPSRTPLVLAKVLLSALVGAVVGGIATAAGLALSIALHGGGADFGDPGVLRVLGDLTLFAAVVSVSATALGLVFHSTIATLGATLGYLYIVPVVISLVPLDAFAVFSETMPGKAASNFFSITTDPSELDPVAGAIASIVWTIALVVFAAVWVKRRNA